MAVTVRNTDNVQNSVNINVGGFSQEIILKAGEVYDTKGRSAVISMGGGSPVTAKRNENIVIKRGMIVDPNADAPVPPAAALDISKIPPKH